MQVKIFSGNVGTEEHKKALETRINEFLKNLPCADVVKTETLKTAEPDFISVLIWLRADAK